MSNEFRQIFANWDEIEPREDEGLWNTKMDLRPDPGEGLSYPENDEDPDSTSKELSPEYV